MFTRVYGPILLREKKDFWEELKTIRGLWDDPWCIGGDFNFVGLIGEKRNDFRFIANMRRLLNVIKELRPSSFWRSVLVVRWFKFSSNF